MKPTPRTKLLIGPAKLIVPHHYYVWDVLTRGSTLLPPDAWVNSRAGSIWTGASAVRLNKDLVAPHRGTAFCFGEHVAFEKPDPKLAQSGA